VDDLGSNATSCHQVWKRKSLCCVIVNIEPLSSVKPGVFEVVRVCLKPVRRCVALLDDHQAELKTTRQVLFGKGFSSSEEDVGPHRMRVEMEHATLKHIRHNLALLTFGRGLGEEHTDLFSRGRGTRTIN